MTLLSASMRRPGSVHVYTFDPDEDTRPEPPEPVPPAPPTPAPPVPAHTLAPRPRPVRGLWVAALAWVVLVAIAWTSVVGVVALTPILTGLAEPEPTVLPPITRPGS